MGNSLADFIIIGPRTSHYTPPKPRSGYLVILCTWVGAARKRIAKYTALYRCIVPDARILLVESSVGILTSAFARRQRMVKFGLAAAAVLETLAECEHRSPPYFEESLSGCLDCEEPNG